VARLLSDYRIGVVASYGRSETDYNLVDGGLETDSIRFGGFVSRDVSKLTATVTGSVSFDAHDLERETNVADQEAEATTEGRTFLILALMGVGSTGNISPGCRLVGSKA